MTKCIRFARRNTIAWLALFLALAASTATAKQLITGAEIADDSVTGADVLESSLGRVADADALDGLGDLVPLRVAFTLTSGEARQESLQCPGDGVMVRGTVYLNGRRAAAESEQYSRASYTVTTGGFTESVDVEVVAVCLVGRVS